MTHASRPHPPLRLKPGQEGRVRQGHPWVFANEIALDAETKALPPGALVTVTSSRGEALGTAIFNRHTLIAARLLSRQADAKVDAGFFRERLRQARLWREALIPVPFYRLAHAEADGLPGTVIDRYGEVIVLQLNTAGMDALQDELLSALDDEVSPTTVVLRNDTQARALEGLEQEVRFARGNLDGEIEVLENGARFLAEPAGGQKTGWFYDQRDNRAWVARLAGGKRMLDLYSYTGGFAIQAALAGASEVVAVDRSESALALCARAAALNDVATRVETVREEVFGHLQGLRDRAASFDIVVADPPAFVKSKKDLKQGLRGYRKLFRMAGGLVAPGGVFFAASCSHHVDPAEFERQVRLGLADAGRTGRVLRASGAGPDHPVHVFLPESDYLKGRLMILD